MGPKIRPQTATQRAFFTKFSPAFARAFLWRGARAAKVQAWLQWAKACRITFAEKTPLLENCDLAAFKYNYGKGCKVLIVRKRFLPPGLC